MVEVPGEIDMATAAGFVAAHLTAAAEVHEPDVLVDLRRVPFFDCSGLRAARLLRRFSPLPDLPPVPPEENQVVRSQVAVE